MADYISTPLSPSINISIYSPTPSTSSLSISPSISTSSYSKIKTPYSPLSPIQTNSKLNNNNNNNNSNNNSNNLNNISNNNLNNSSKLTSNNSIDKIKLDVNMLDNNNKQLSQRKLKLLGVNEDEMKRWTALKKMGLNDEDYNIGNQIFFEGHGGKKLPPITKVEKVTGYSIAQVKRKKAVNLLGTTEEDIIEERSRRLSNLGRSQHSLHNKTILPKLSEKRRATIFG